MQQNRSLPSLSNAARLSFRCTWLSVVEELRAGHDSMVYGLSWIAPFGSASSGSGSEEGTRISPAEVASASALASCSFYDSSLNVWQPRAVGALHHQQQ